MLYITEKYKYVHSKVWIDLFEIFGAALNEFWIIIYLLLCICYFFV